MGGTCTQPGSKLPWAADGRPASSLLVSSLWPEHSVQNNEMTPVTSALGTKHTRWDGGSKWRFGPRPGLGEGAEEKGEGGGALVGTEGRDEGRLQGVRGRQREREKLTGSLIREQKSQPGQRLRSMLCPGCLALVGGALPGFSLSVVKKG